MLRRAAWLALVVACGAEAAHGQGTRADGPVVEALRVVDMVEPAYPLPMTLQGITSGEVEVVFGVDAEGRLDDCLVTAYSRPEFAKEVEAALRRWRFEPLRVDGVPVSSRGQLAFSFEARGMVITRTVIDSVTMLAGSMLEPSRRVQVLSRRSELDRPLAVVESVAPLYPARLAESGQAGAVTVGFFVDEQGCVRLPVIEDGAQPWFGEVATRAIMQWRFEPPRKKGRPAVVMARQQFVFTP